MLFRYIALMMFLVQVVSAVAYAGNCVSTVNPEQDRAGGVSSGRAQILVRDLGDVAEVLHDVSFNSENSPQVEIVPIPPQILRPPLTFRQKLAEIEYLGRQIRRLSRSLQELEHQRSADERNLALSKSMRQFRKEQRNSTRELLKNEIEKRVLRIGELAPGSLERLNISIKPRDV